MPYIGKGGSGSFGIRERYEYTATSGQTAFTSTDINGKVLTFDNGSLIDVMLNGVMLKITTDWSAASGTVTLVSGASASDEVTIIVYDVFALSDAMPKTGGTFSGDVTLTGSNYNVVWDKSDDALEFADNAKATFGADGDLEISHSGTNSLIKDTGTGKLRICGSAVQLRNSGNTENMLTAAENGAVNIYYDNSAKLATTSAGVSVTGNVIMASGNGIDFSATANSSGSMDNELFDDYEEGTWTWTLTDGSNNATATAGGWGTGYYRKIGGLAYVTAYVRVSSIGSMSGDAKITGLPYTSLSGNTIGTASGFACGRMTNADITAGHVMGYQVGAGVSEVQLRLWDDAGGTTAMQASELSGDVIFIMTVIYPTA